MKEAISALTEKTAELEQEAHDLKEATDRKTARATREFRIMSGLLFAGMIALFLIALTSFNVNRDNNLILKDVRTLVEYVEEAQNRPMNPELVEAYKSIQEIEDILCAEFPQHCEP